MHRTIFLCFAPLLLLGCNRSDAAVTGNGQIRLNPNPTKAYVITLRIDNAPGEFKYVVGGAQYDVINEDECGKVHRMTGTPMRITRFEPVEMNRISETEYRGLVYVDQMLDSDIHGNGICRWEFTTAGATLKATGAHEETRYFADVDAADFASGAPHTLYHARHAYPRARPTEDFPDLPWLDNHASTGQRDPNAFVPAVRATAFALTMTAEELVP